MALILALTLCASAALAAPEDRGLRGYYLGGGVGFALGQATDDDGRDTGSFYGSGYHFRVGEEVFPGFSLGLDFLGVGGAGGNDEFDAGGGGFLLQAGWRPLRDRRALELFVGTGVGALSIAGKNGGEYDGLVGGAMYQVGALYDFQLSGDVEGGGGFYLGPSLSALIFPTAGGEAEGMIFSVNVELTWFAGRAVK